MFRLLELGDDGEFRLQEYEDESTAPIYAILSHTWSTNNDNELSCEDLINGRGENKLGFQKLQFCQQQAAKDKIQHCWIDTCCIDKKNNVELNEAIISMFRWYQNAARCYVYLSDVTADEASHRTSWETHFKQSRWFTRGWTLQELIAPRRVEFFSREGTWLGDKSSLEQSICECTGIPIPALRGRPLSAFSIPERRSWARSRSTKREEDGAYCLTGIFDVTVIPAYGEKHRAFDRLDEEIERSRERIQLNMQTKASVNHRYSGSRTPAKRRRSELESSVDADQERVILESLKFDQIEVRRMTIKNAHARTCKWLLNDPQYLEWLSNGENKESHGFLWIKGKPGSGKSTIMKFALDSSRRRMKDIIQLSFFFNARGSDLEKSVAGLYRTILVQLLEKMPSLKSVFSTLGPLATKIGLEYFWSAEMLKTLLTEAFLNLGENSVVCFIDALDECEEREIREMISFFQHICESTVLTSNQLRICFASRHYPHITIQKGQSLDLDGKEGHREDILSYLTTELNIGHSKRANEVRSKVADMSSGIFIWVFLVTGILNKAYDSGDISGLEKSLTEIPTDIHELFRDILTRDSRNRNELMLCVQWLLFAKKPLTVRQLHHAILFGIKKALPSKSSQEDTTLEHSKLFILDVSKGLTETTKAENPTVQFIHESVKDFLLKNNGLEELWPGLTNNTEGKSQDQLKQCCLSCISINISEYHDGEIPRLHTTAPKEMQAARDSINLAFPFMCYAVENILYHADKAAQKGISQVSFLQNFSWKNWSALANVFERYTVRRYKQDASPIYIMAEKNAPNLIEIHPDVASYLHFEGQRYGTPLFAALAIGNTAAARAFLRSHAIRQRNCRDFGEWLQLSSDAELKNGFRRDFACSRRESVLSHLVEFAHDKILEFCLKTDALSDYTFELGSLAEDIIRHNRCSFILQLLDAALRDDLPQWLCDLALFFACRKEHEQNVKSLLEKGACSTVTYRLALGTKDALTVASEQGNICIVKMLLDNDADLKNSQALVYALEAGQEQIGLLLLEKGADPSVRHYRYTSALASAIRQNLTSVIEKILEVYPDTDDSRDLLKDALYTSASAGNVFSTQKLLEKGVEADSRHRYPQETALQVASRMGNEQTAQLLLNNRANVMKKNRAGNNALHIACEARNVHVVRVLLGHCSDVNCQGIGGLTALHFAFGYSTTGWIYHGNKKGKTVHFRHTCSEDYKLKCQQIVRMLLYKNADPNLRDIQGSTALHYASRLGYFQVVRMLLEKNADLHILNRRKHSALHLALEVGHEKIVNLLLEHGAKRTASS